MIEKIKARIVISCDRNRELKLKKRRRTVGEVGVGINASLAILDIWMKMIPFIFSYEKDVGS